MSGISLYAEAAAVAAALFCSYKAVQFLLRPYYASNLRDVPGPKDKNIVIGHAYEVENEDEAVFFDREFEEHGPVIRVFGLFQVCVYDISAVFGWMLIECFVDRKSLL